MPVTQEINSFISSLKSISEKVSKAIAYGSVRCYFGSFFSETLSEAHILKTNDSEYLKVFAGEFLKVVISQLDAKIYPAVLYQEIVNYLRLLFNGFKGKLARELNISLNEAQEIVHSDAFDVLRLSAVNMRAYTLSHFKQLDTRASQRTDETITAQFIGNSAYITHPRLLCEVAHSAAVKALEKKMQTHVQQKTTEQASERSKETGKTTTWLTLPTFSPSPHQHVD